MNTGHTTPDTAPSDGGPAPTGRPASKSKSWLTAAILLAVALTGGVIVLQTYRSLLREQAEIRQRMNRLPIISRLEENLIATERSGDAVELKDLKGKVILAGHVYTRCPRGCAGVATIMEGIQQDFGNDPAFHLVSFSVDPEHDDPAQLREFCRVQGIDGSNWWFLTGEGESIRQYLVKQFRFNPVREIPEAERMNEWDLFAHDMRVALVDSKGHVRGFYDVLSADHGEIAIEKLRRDLRQLLDEAHEGSEDSAS